MVQAVRADERTPVTQDRRRARGDRAREPRPGDAVPARRRRPRVNFQSDSGIAAGYAYFNVRGIGQTRLNITLDGVPLQDPEDQALYFANFGDFASVVDSIQVQRGVGTSSVGAASYGGSVNFASVGPATSSGSRRRRAAGRGGRRAARSRRSGPLGAGFGLYGRYSAQTSDGFRDHSGVDQRTAYFGATRTGLALVLQALRLLRPREVAARLPRDRRDDARERPAPQRPHARREGRLRPGLRAGAVHLARRLRDDAHGPGLLQRCPGLVPDLGRGAREPAAVRDRRPLRRPRARGHAPAAAGSASPGARTPTTSAATTSWTSWAARAPTPTPASRTRSAAS